MNNKLFFINLSNLASNAGHTARLRHQLFELSHISEVTILSLGEKEKKEIVENFKEVNFLHYQISFKGWDVVNKATVCDSIVAIAAKRKPDLVILNIEIWDLIVGLKMLFEQKNIKFIAVCHAMPFLISPQVCSTNYEHDVRTFISSGISKYRVDYISKHFLELPDIINSNVLVANNRTVNYYFNNYFPDGNFWCMNKSYTQNIQQRDSEKKYDFCYMARIEEGKGVEYLHAIFKETSLQLGRKINVAIMGRADDIFSKNELKDLLNDINNFYNISFYGWANDTLKVDVLNKSKCFIYPSTYDNFPTVVNEALACGLPVVVWDTLFFRLNYLGCGYVKSSEIGNVSGFVNNCIYILNNYKKFTTEIIKDFSMNNNPYKLALYDLELFEKIIKHERTFNK